jgi:hypothetical protein
VKRAWLSTGRCSISGTPLGSIVDAVQPRFPKLLWMASPGRHQHNGQQRLPENAADSSIASDTGLATCAGHRPSGGRSLRKQRTVNPPIAPTRYNFLYSSSRPALRTAACGGRPRAGSAKDSCRVTGLTFQSACLSSDNSAR